LGYRDVTFAQIADDLHNEPPQAHQENDDQEEQGYGRTEHPHNFEVVGPNCSRAEL
jgi:hypothetical protein